MPQKLPLLFLATLAFTASLDAQTVLYQETFNGADVPLNGQTPNISITNPTHGTGGDWTADANIRANGTVTTSSAVSGSLAFDPVDGYIYELTLTGNYGGSGWLSVGFTGSATATGPMFGTDVGLLWALTRPGGASDFQVAHANATGGINAVGGTNNSDNPTTISIILDTTDGAGGWDVSWYVAGSATPFATQSNISSAFESGIEGVSIGTNSSNNEYQSLQLSVSSIPEPSTYAMILAAGALGVCLVRRRS